MKVKNALRFSGSFPYRSWLVLILLFSLGVANGQQNPLTLTVRVLDPNKKVVGDMSVELIKEGTTQPITPTEIKAGAAVFKNLEPGAYKLVVLSGGVRIFEEDISLSASRTEDVILPGIARVQPPPLQVEEPESLSSLPNQNNDLTPLLQIAPGALPLGSSALGLVVVDGKGLDQQTARLDGVDFTILSTVPTADSAIDPLTSFTLPAVAGNLGASSLRTGAFEARSGPGTGAVAENVTYTGSGRDKTMWTGEFYGEHRNDVFNARNFFDFESKNALRRTRFGGKASRALDPFGRYVILVAYDGIRGRVERPIYEAVPIDATCCATQPFSHLFRSYLPSGTQIVAGASQNPDFLVARRRARTSVNSNAFDVRFEFSPFIKAKDSDASPALRAADLFTLRYTNQGAENLVPDGVTGRRQRQNILFNNLMAAFQFRSSLDTTHDIRFGLNAVRARMGTEVPAETDSSLSAASVSLSGTVAAVGLPGELTSVPVATIGRLIKVAGRGFSLTPSSYSLSYGIEHKFKKHLLSAGVEGRLIRIGVDRLAGLTYSFPNIASLRSGTPASVNFQSDLSAPGPFSSGTGPRQARQQYVAGYVQMVSNVGVPSPDPTSKLESIARLRITYGLRYDYFSPVRERDGRAVLINPLNGAILPSSTAFYATPKLNLQPRASLIYRFADTGFFSNTVFAGGAGMYSGIGRTGDYLLPIDSDRFSTGMTALPFPVDPSILINNFLAHPDTRQFQPLAFSRDFVGLERAYKWDAKLTQTISGYDIGVFYSGNAGRNLPLANIGNKITRVFTNPDPTKPAIVQREFDIVNGGQIFKPFGEFFFRTSDGHSRYDSLTFQFSRNRNARPAPDNSWLAKAVAGLNAQYILSRSVGNASGTILSNPFDSNADFGNNTGVPRHVFKFSSVYELWKVNDSSPTKSWLSWKIMPVLRVSSGLPLLVRLNRPDVVYVDAAGTVFSGPATGRTAIINTPGGGESGSARVPNLVPGANPYLRNDREYLNPAAFSIPAPGSFGQIRRGQLHGPKIVQLDLGLRRNLFETEKLVSAQFQIDIFNVFNRANFTNPTSSIPGVLGTSAVDKQIQPNVPLTRATAGTFGILTSADPGRVIQFSLTFRLNDGFTSYRIKN
jgi:hypothetical protein